MNILSQILNYETKNLLINQILEKIKKKLTDLFESLLINFSSYRYIINTLDLQKCINKIIREAIILFIQSIDNEYKNSEIRKKEYHINKSNVERTIFTIFGEINYTRTLYKNKNSNKYYFFCR